MGTCDNGHFSTEFSNGFVAQSLHAFFGKYGLHYFKDLPNYHHVNGLKEIWKSVGGRKSGKM